MNLFSLYQLWTLTWKEKIQVCIQVNAIRLGAHFSIAMIHVSLLEFKRSIIPLFVFHVSCLRINLLGVFAIFHDSVAGPYRFKRMVLNIACITDWQTLNWTFRCFFFFKREYFILRINLSSRMNLYLRCINDQTFHLLLCLALKLNRVCLIFM